MPEQLVVSTGVTAMVGTGNAATATVPIPAQVPSETATVYVVVCNGLTITLEVLEVAGNQVYEFAAAIDVRVAAPPAQTTVGLANMLTEIGATEMVVTAVDVPHPFCPLTV